MGSSTYWAWLFPSTLIRWLGGAICPARTRRQNQDTVWWCKLKCRAAGSANSGEPPHLVPEVYHSTCASQPLKHLFPRFQLPDKGYRDFLKLTLDTCEQTWTWISQDPKLNKPKHQLNGSSRQLFQQVTGFLQQLKAFSSSNPKVYMKPIPSSLNS